MPAKVSLISALQVDPALAQTAANALDAGERQYIDDQIRGSQQHLVDSVVGGTLCTWRTVDLSSPTLGRGDVVCLVGEYVTLATAAAVAAAGGVAFGIVMASAAPGTAVRIAVGGFVKSTTTGLSAATGFAVLNQTTGRLIGKTAIDQGDIALGVTNAAGVLTLSIDYPRAFGFKSLLSGAGDEAALSFGYTVNKPSGNDSGLVLDMTDTASPGTSRLIDLKIGGTRKLALVWDGTNINPVSAGQMTLQAATFCALQCGAGYAAVLESPGGAQLWAYTTGYVHYFNGNLVRTDTLHNAGACTVLWAGTVTSVTYKVDRAANGSAGKDLQFLAGEAGLTGARSAGGSITIQAGIAQGDSGGGATGGRCDISAGAGSTNDGAGGALNLSGGQGGATNGNGGAVTIQGGGGSGTGVKGDVIIGASATSGESIRRRAVATADATATTIGEVIPIPDNTCLIIVARVAGKVNGGTNSAGYESRCAIKRHAGGIATIVGACVTTILGEDDAAWDSFIDVDGGNNARVRVKGVAATNVDWTSHVHILD